MPPYQSHIFYQPQYSSQFPQYPESEIWAEQPHLKSQVLNIIAPFVKYGLEEAKDTSYVHALQEVAAMTYLIGQGMDPQTAYLTVESWEINECEGMIY
ncbi:hypothetical protein ACE8FZ_15100 [Peribacillus frigoritolerans]|uniref:hypothetical protein n=1 Tax=Peribacillus frigoritolerans TaxID=450367 RepID=UPI0007BF0747